MSTDWSLRTTDNIEPAKPAGIDEMLTIGQVTCEWMPLSGYWLIGMRGPYGALWKVSEIHPPASKKVWREAIHKALKVRARQATLKDSEVQL